MKSQIGREKVKVFLVPVRIFKRTVRNLFLYFIRKGISHLSVNRKSLDICAERKRGLSDLELLCKELDQVPVVFCIIP
jgi:hypothetical protein